MVHWVKRAYLAGDRLNHPREVVVLILAMLHPWREIPQFAIVSVVGHPHLRTNKEDLLVVDYHTAIIDYVFVDNGPDQVVSGCTC